MNIPDEAVGAAAKTLESIGSVGPNMTPEHVARRAIESAMPAIREAIAQEIEDDYGYITGTVGMADAASIVRGGAS